MNRFVLLFAFVCGIFLSLAISAAPIATNQLDSEKILLGRAQEKWHIGDVTSSKQLYLELFNRNPKNLKALIGLAQIEEHLGNSTEAESYFQSAFKHSPTDATVFTAYGRYLLKHNRIDEAVKAFERALSIDATLPEANVELAVIKMSRFADAESAIKLYKKALESKPLEISYLYGLSLALESSGKIQDAIAPLDKIINYDPSLTLPYKLKGNYHRRLQQLDQSIANFKLVLEKAPAPAALDYITLGDVYAESGNTDKAIELYQQAMKEFGENEVVYTKLAYVYHMNGDYKQAEILYQKAMLINSTYSDPHNNMAYIELMYKNNKMEAMKFAKNAVKYSPGNPNFLDTLGIVYMAMNEYQKAQEVFQQALVISPNNTEIQQNLEKAKRAQ